MPIHTDPAAARGWSAATQGFPPLSRRAFLQTLGVACAARLRPIAMRLTALADDFDWLMRWCSFSAGPCFAAG